VSPFCTPSATIPKSASGQLSDSPGGTVRKPEPIALVALRTGKASGEMTEKAGGMQQYVSRRCSLGQERTRGLWNGRKSDKEKWTPAFAGVGPILADQRGNSTENISIVTAGACLVPSCSPTCSVTFSLPTCASAAGSAILISHSSLLNSSASFILAITMHAK
jgi:hypothetical protein